MAFYIKLHLDLKRKLKKKLKRIKLVIVIGAG